MSRRVRFYDTTLRDGEQMPGIAFDRGDRIAIARALDDLGVDEIELGFAASGAPQREDMRAVVALGLRATTFSLARPLPGDLEAVLDTGVQGISFFVSGSEEHLQHKLRKPFAEALEMMVRSVEAARAEGLIAHAALEDATRTPLDRARAFAEAVWAAGGRRISLADTVGWGTPASVTALVQAVLDAAPGLAITLHPHDDFGLATANALAAIEAGATGLSTTVNGIGERSGNGAMEECAAALVLRLGYETGLDLAKLSAVSRLVAERSGVPIPPNKAVVGANSFRHESGIHVAAILRHPRTYEPYDPALVGAERSIVLGKTTGRAAIRYLAGPAADALDDAALARLMARIKEAAESGQAGEPGALEALIAACREG